MPTELNIFNSIATNSRNRGSLRVMVEKKYSHCDKKWLSQHNKCVRCVVLSNLIKGLWRLLFTGTWWWRTAQFIKVSGFGVVQLRHRFSPEWKVGKFELRRGAGIGFQVNSCTVERREDVVDDAALAWVPAILYCGWY